MKTKDKDTTNKKNINKIDMSKDIKVYDLTYAKHDLTHCLIIGLFQSLKKGDYKKHKLDSTYIIDKTKNRQVEFKGPEPLGVSDMKVLQGLVAMAGLYGKRLTENPKTEGGKELRRRLELQFDAINDTAITIKSSYYKLAKEIGYNPSDTNAMRKCIERLWATSVIVQEGNKRVGFRILSQYTSKTSKRDGVLYVALNPLIAKAIMGGQHAYIDMDEIRALKSDPASLLHQHLCGWINPGKIGRISIDKIIKYIWPDETNANAMKYRYKTAKMALEKLKSINWTVKEYAKDKWQITRPKMPTEQLPGEDSE